MKANRRDTLPLEPLLHAYLDVGVMAEEQLATLPGLGQRFEAILQARRTFLDAAWLQKAPDGAFQTAIVAFYEACVCPPLHSDRVLRRARTIRLALGCLRDGGLAGCLSPEGPYFIAGLGPSFWSALSLASDPAGNVGWTPAVEGGLQRLGLLDQGRGDLASLKAAGGVLAQLQRLAPERTGLHCEHFLSLVSLMEGRQLLAGSARLSATPDVAAIVRQERARQPLRGRLRERGQALADAQELLQAALADSDGKRLGEALATADPLGSASAPLDWGAEAAKLTLWVSRLWEAGDPWPILAEFWQADPIPGAGLWLPAAVLHLRDPQKYPSWNDSSRAGLACIDDGTNAGPIAERYRLYCDALTWLRQRHTIHPLEAPAILEALAECQQSREEGPSSFGGFCPDTFRFLQELEQNNSRSWMETQRARYQFVLRDPLVELGSALAGRYVDPVLRGRHGFDLESEVRDGLALTRLARNDHGRSRPYNTAFWIAFCRRTPEGKRDPIQFFVRVDAAGLHFGLKLGGNSAAERRQLQKRLRSLAPGLIEELKHPGAQAGELSFPTDRESFESWLTEREPTLARHLTLDDPLLGRDELVGEILLTFDRLVPLYRAATTDASPEAVTAPAQPYSENDFLRETFLDADWLRRARSLLQLKRQLILQGVPGTGKTHLARCLARLLTGDRPEAVCIVQMHPAYSYEEFVEGIRVKTIESDGRHEVTYPVEDGVLCDFAARASLHPAQPHVLLLDEINRANLPRVFGELLYLLEYRDQEVVLPCSRRRFRLPPNLYVVGTMNASDRSIVPVDQALRRRFSFVELSPDAGVLRSWLRQHPPREGPAFVEEVVGLFERVNGRLQSDLGPTCQVGHSYFMVPQLDEPRLRTVWKHQVQPLLQEYLLLQPGRAVPLDIDAFLLAEAPRSAGRMRQGM